MTNYKLKDILKIKNGRDHQDLMDGKYPVYGSGGIMRYVNQYLYDKPSILLPRKGTLDNIQYCDTPFWTVDTTYYTEIDQEKVNAYFLYRYLRLLDLSNLNTGTGVPSMTFDSYYDITVNLPDLPTQDAIASILSSLDRKISLNRKANEVLESMAKQLYDYWFVQFDFPNAEGKPYKSSGGKMVYNETHKREIPEGWEVKQLAELLELSENGEWGQEEMDANTIDINCIRGADIVDLIGAPRRYLPNNKTSKLMKEHDIIVEISGGSPTQATGRCNYVSKEILDLYNGKLTCSNFCKFLRLEDKEYAPYFYYLWSLIYKNGNMFHYEGKTSGIKNLQIDNLLAEYWCIPPKDIASRFFNICTDLNSKVGKNKKETLRLTSLRDYLLPLLMNGQVKVS